MKRLNVGFKHFYIFTSLVYFVSRLNTDYFLNVKLKNMYYIAFFPPAHKLAFLCVLSFLLYSILAGVHTQAQYSADLPVVSDIHL